MHWLSVGVDGMVNGFMALGGLTRGLEGGSKGMRKNF